MPLDPQVQTVLAAVKAAGLPELWQLTPDQAREAYRTRIKRLDVKEETIHHWEDRQIPGPDTPITIRVYQPRERAAGEKLPVLVWFHGGGFVIGDLDTHDSACRRLAKEGDCLVVAVHYRLAPEAKFPAAVEDSMAAVRWVATHGDEIGADPHRIGVGGDSAGGNLAAVCALIARDEGSPKLSHQLLIYPCTAPEPETRTHKQFAEGYLLTRNTITWFYRQYLRSARDTGDFRFGPLIADDVSNLPPAFVLVAGFDPLRDEGVQYANRLIEAGNDTTLVNMAGMIHGFYVMLGAIDAASEAIRQSGTALRKAFATS
ncbi:MAG: alpha/beta hydrolase fold domain-containing protein [Betaproteobacteria bacterium]|nr:alpha/beta hydrolase fold domain-containing protein [Betaproteobacteria bacterium]